MPASLRACLASEFHHLGHQGMKPTSDVRAPLSEEGSIPGSFLREDVHDPRMIAAVRSKIGTMEMRRMLSGFSLLGKMEDPWEGRGGSCER